MIVQGDPAAIVPGHGHLPGGGGEVGIAPPLHHPGAQGLQGDVPQEVEPDARGAQGVPPRLLRHLRRGGGAGEGLAEQDAQGGEHLVGLGRVILDGKPLRAVGDGEPHRLGRGGGLDGAARIAGGGGLLLPEQGRQVVQPAPGALPGQLVEQEHPEGEGQGGQGEQDDEQALEPLQPAVPAAAGMLISSHGQAPPPAA